MASNNTSQPQAAKPKRYPKLLRYVAVVFLTLIVLVGLTVVIIWLVVKPKKLVYTIEDGSINGFNLTQNHLNATFDFVLRSYNPNHRISIYYDSMDVSVVYDDQTIALGVVEPFLQGHRNVTRLGVNLKAQNVSLSLSVAKDLRVAKSANQVELDVWVKARIRFKVGVWKSKDRTLRISCSPLLHLYRPQNFMRTHCAVEL